MEFYDKALVQQQAPLVAVAFSGQVAEALRPHFDRATLSDSLWDNVIIKNRLMTAKFRFRYEADESAIVSKISPHYSKTRGVHSPISPFNASSDIFPNGIISSNWFHKYANDVPFAVLCALDLDHDAANDAVLGQNLKSLREKYASFNVKFIAIIVAEGSPVEEVTQRLSYVRQQSGLANLSSLFYFDTSSASIAGDCESLASAILTSLKTSATDFYSNIELRVEQRFQKYYTMPKSEVRSAIELTPKILETRNLIKQGILLQLMHPHNVESSLQVLEHAYDNMVDIITKNKSHYFSKSSYPHDKKVFLQWRTILDAIAIHLVRGYFSLEDPLAALRRHSAHILAMNAILQSTAPEPRHFWVAIQYEWLAELLVLIPDSIVKELFTTVEGGKTKKSQSRVSFYGGVSLPDKSHVITAPSLLLKKAADVLNNIEEISSTFNYGNSQFSTPDDIKRHRIKLLEMAKQHSDISSMDTLLTCEIADIHMDLKQYSKAYSLYRLAFSDKRVAPWSHIHSSISRKLLKVSEELKNPEQIFEQLANLSVSKFDKSSIIFPKIDCYPLSSINLDGSENFFSLEAILYNKSKANEVRALDTVMTQLYIEQLLDVSFFKKVFTESDVQLWVKCMTVTYDGGNVFEILPNGSQEECLQISGANGNPVFNFHPLTSSGLLVLQFPQKIQKPGLFQITGVTIESSLHFKSKEGEFTLDKAEFHRFCSDKIVHSANIYDLDETGKLTFDKRLMGRSPNRLVVKPYRPQISAEIDFPFESTIIGEQLGITVCFTRCENVQAEMKFQSASVEISSTFYNDMVETKAIQARVNWESQKDDEPLNILEFLNSNNTRLEKKFYSRIGKSPSGALPKESLPKIAFQFRLFATDCSGEQTDFELKSLELNVLVNAFPVKCTVSPRPYREGIPNPFIYHANSGGHSIPSPSRCWQMELDEQTSKQIHKLQGIKITGVDFNLSSENPEISANWVDEMHSSDNIFKRKFVTQSKHRLTAHNVCIFANATIMYKRDGFAEENNFKTDDYKIILPLQDPRLLLEVEKQGDEFWLHYTIENPTSRIFTFSSTMTTDEALRQGVNWTFDNAKNELSLKQSIFPVLPFSQHELDFYAQCKFEEERESIELPHLIVYDLQYKVNLPTLSLQDEITETKAGLIISL